VIRANELRIENWVYRQSNKLIVDISIPYQLKIITSKECHKYFPIPLTPEILEKCGFKKGRYTYVDRSFNDEAFILDGRRYVITKINTGTLKEPNEVYALQYFPYPQSQNTIHTNLLYLHQLQNLYFAMEENELEIKL